MIQENLNQITLSVMNNAIELSNKMLAEVEGRIKNIQAPIMTVKRVDLKEITLKQPASEILPDLLQLLEQGLAVYLKGPAGCGKTTAVAQASEVLECPFYHFVMSPDMGQSAIFGRQTMTGWSESIIVKAAKHGGLLFIDEIDNAAPESIKAINGLGDRSGTLYNSVTGELIKIHKDFKFVAAGNTFSMGADSVYTAASRLDGSSLDRFSFIEMNYNERLEESICKSYSKDMRTLAKLHIAREKLAKQNALQIISTRKIENIYKCMSQANWSEEKALQICLLNSWPENLAEQVGLK